MRDGLLHGVGRDLGAIPNFLPLNAAGRPIRVPGGRIFARAPEERAIRAQLHHMERPLHEVTD